MLEHPYCAPAKLNLFLHIVGRRPDGYHLLESAFVLTDLSDCLRIVPREDGSLIRTGDIVGDSEKDLCIRAAKALRTACHSTLGAEIDVIKRVPSGAGLGGGSSDAATVLWVLNHLWNLHLPKTRLMEIALSLGADIPFFLFGRSAFARGVGEILSEINIKPCWFALAMPSTGTSTASIYASKLLKRDMPSVSAETFQQEQDAIWPTLYGANVMEPAAIAENPEIALAITALGPGARMTGSGSAVFLPCQDRKAAQHAVDKLPQPLRGHVLELLPRHPLDGLIG